MLTQQQVIKLAEPITQHVITKWRVEGNTLILINAIGQKFIVPLPTILEAGPTPETAVGAGPRSEPGAGLAPAQTAKPPRRNGGNPWPPH